MNIYNQADCFTKNFGGRSRRPIIKKFRNRPIIFSFGHCLTQTKHFWPGCFYFFSAFSLFRVMDHRILQVMDYVFVIGMGAEIWLRVLAEGLLFTPKAVVKDTAGILDISMFIVSLIWVCWMPKVVAPHSLAQILMLLRCFRPLRQELLNIWT